jgi:riboflavin kinase/FMN adenylyltransferase
MKVHKNLAQLPNFRNSVITIGSFDGVHRGHQKLIKRINELAGEIKSESIVITFYPHPRQVIFPKDKSLVLLNSLEEKLALFRKYGVDHVVVVPFSVEFSQQKPQEYVERFLVGKFNPSYIVIGYDHKFGLNRQGDISLLQSYETTHNFKTIKIDEEEISEITISSTKIRNALINNEIDVANNYLNYPYMISGKVIYGEQVGSKIGFKTANIRVDDDNKLIPPSGIYAVKVHHGQNHHEGMLYIGNKPTIHDNAAKTIEVNIFDFNENIYGEYIRLELIKFIRNDEKFNGLDALTLQLRKDEISARGILQKYRANNHKEERNTAIVILNYNGESIIESYLPSTLHSTTHAVDYVLIDNASTDESVPFMKEWHPEYRLIEFTKNYGYAGGYNKGLEHVKNKYVALINSDIRCTQSWLDPIIEMMERDETIGAVSPKIRSIAEPDHFEYAGASGGFMDFLSYPFCRGRIFSTVEKDENQYDEVKEIFWASGAAMVVRKDIFDKLEGFDSSYFAHQEEIDFCWRLKRAGYKIMVQPKSLVYHLGGGTLAYESPNKTYLNFRNNLITLIKNDESSFWFFKFIYRIILDGLAGIQILAQGKPKNVWAIARAHWYIFPRVFSLMDKRKTTRNLINKYRIGKYNRTGLYSKSIVAQYFILAKKKFVDLSAHGWK